MRAVIAQLYSEEMTQDAVRKPMPTFRHHGRTATLFFAPIHVIGSLDATAEPARPMPHFPVDESSSAVTRLSAYNAITLNAFTFSKMLVEVRRHESSDVESRKPSLGIGVRDEAADRPYVRIDAFVDTRGLRVTGADVA